jgi:hypothetical protein
MTPVPAPLRAPAKVIAPELARPFDGDVYDLADGLPQAQRQVIVGAARQQLALSPQGIEALDQALRDFGAILIGKGNRPLTPEAVRATLRFSHGPDADRPAFANQRWVSNGDRSIVIEAYSDGSARATYRKGDRTYSTSTGTRFHRDLARASVYEAARWVKDASSGELHLTTAQARTLYPLVADLRREYHELKSVRQLAEGSVEVVVDGESMLRTWITPGGERVGSDPVEQARGEEASRARLSEKRVFDITPWAPGAVMGVSIAGLIVAGTLVAAGWFARLRRPAAVLQMGLSVLTLVGWVLLLRAANGMPEVHWTIRRAAADPPYVLTALAALAVLVLGGLWIPLALVRRAKGVPVG